MLETFFIELVALVSGMTFADTVIIGMIVFFFILLLIFNSMTKVVSGLKDTIRYISEAGVKKESSGDAVMLEMTKANVKITENQLKLTEVIHSINSKLESTPVAISNLDDKIILVLGNQGKMLNSLDKLSDDVNLIKPIVYEEVL